MTIQEIFEIWAIVMFMILMTGLVIVSAYMVIDIIKSNKR